MAKKHRPPPTPPVVVNIRHDDFDIYIGRPSEWGNPFKIGVHGDRTAVIRRYRNWFVSNHTRAALVKLLRPLAGKRLGCYCKPKGCHGDVLVELFREYCM